MGLPTKASAWSRDRFHWYVIRTVTEKLQGQPFVFWCFQGGQNDIASVSSKEFLDIQAFIESGFNLKRVREIKIKYSQMHRTDMYSHHSSII